MEGWITWTDEDLILEHKFQFLMLGRTPTTPTYVRTLERLNDVEEELERRGLEFGNDGLWHRGKEKAKIEHSSIHWC